MMKLIHKKIIFNESKNKLNRWRGGNEQDGNRLRSQF